MFRVDHFLGKEPVEDLLVLRFANTLLEPLWNREWIDHFEITMAEDFDVADRGSFYDAVGTVRDVVQNHLLQVLAYLLMEPPTSEAADDQRDAKHRLLRAMRAVDPAEAVRGRYDGLHRDAGREGGVDDRDLRALTLHVDNWRWMGVPVYLRAGKALPVTLLDVVAVLRTPPKPLFTGSSDAPPPNRLRLRVQPDAGITITLLARAAGRRRRGGADPDRGRLPARCSARCTRPTSTSSPTPWRATRRTSPGSTTWRRPGGSSARSSTLRRHPPTPWTGPEAATLPGPDGWVEPPAPAPAVVGPFAGRGSGRAAA